MENLIMVRGAETCVVAPGEECCFLAVGWSRQSPMQSITVVEEPVEKPAEEPREEQVEK